MSTIDYEFKAKVLSTDLCKKIGYIDRQTYFNELDGIVRDQDLDNQYFDLLMSNDFKSIQEARKINLASFKRVQRLKERIETYLSSGQCIWLTITFNDKALAETSSKTRRKYVSRFLKRVSNHYVANIDYGKTNEREHYHAVVLTDFVSPSLWPHGFIYTERIKNQVTTSSKLSKYVSKLCNHAIKETTKRAVYIYSRSC